MSTAPAGLTIRPELLGDHDAIRRVVGAAFGSDVEPDLVDRIRASPEYVAEWALVAELDGQVVGHVMVSFAALRNSEGERAIAMLSPLAVVPDRQRSGVGGALVRAVLAVVEAAGEPLVVLEGGPNYYGRLGFEPAARYAITLPIPDWAPPEAAQVYRLRAFDPDDPTLRGSVVYPSAFDGVE